MRRSSRATETVSRAEDRETNPAVASIARDFSPRYESHGDDLVMIDITGLERLLGPARAIAGELRRDGAERGMRVHVAVAATRAAAMLLALAHPGIVVVQRGGEAAALAPLPVTALANPHVSCLTCLDPVETSAVLLETCQRWGIKTLGDVAALPPSDVAARLGRAAVEWHAIARGEDRRPLIPTLEAERFEAGSELEWPIEGLEPLSFVLTRLLEPLSTRLERRDRGAAVLHVLLRLVTKTTHARRLELPSPMRDVRTLRTLALLDLESHPPEAAIDRVTVVIDPTPGRIVQHTLFTRPHPTPEQLSTLVARLGAVMGQDRFGAPVVVDTYRPGAFAMLPFRTEHTGIGGVGQSVPDGRYPAPDPRSPVTAALRRCRQPVPARVAVVDGRPTRVTTDRRGFAGGTVVGCAGPWRCSGEWWVTRDVNGSSAAGVGVSPPPPPKASAGLADARGESRASDRAGPHAFNKDEWDVALNDGAVYRIFQDRDTEAWFIDAVID